MAKTHSKYNSTKTEVDGIIFDSRKEANRYKELKAMEQAGQISNLELQKEFVLFPKQTDPVTGKCLEKKCSYFADFVYRTLDGKEIVEDTKGLRLDDYIIKRKAMLFLYGIRIIEI